MKRLVALFVISPLLIMVSGFTTDPNEAVNIPEDNSEVNSFWDGLWRGSKDGARWVGFIHRQSGRRRKCQS